MSLVPDDPGVDTVATRVVYRRSRALDWFAAAMVLAWGISFALPGETLASSPAYAALAERLPEAAWAAIMIAIGVVRIGALLINGALPRGSPPVRFAAAFLGVLIWGYFLAGFLDVSIRMGVVSAGVGVNLVMLAADIYCCGRAAADFMRARHVQRG